MREGMRSFLRTQKEMREIEDLNLMKLHQLKSGLMTGLLTGPVPATEEVSP